MKAGSIFDNILLTDDLATAKKFAEDTWGKLKEAEKKMFDTVSEVRLQLHTQAAVPYSQHEDMDMAYGVCASVVLMVLICGFSLSPHTHPVVTS